jgi:hypothetical protein
MACLPAVATERSHWSINIAKLRELIQQGLALYCQKFESSSDPLRGCLRKGSGGTRPA